jgi:hypothetical protein
MANGGIQLFSHPPTQKFKPLCAQPLFAVLHALSWPFKPKLQMLQLPIRLQ